MEMEREMSSDLKKATEEVSSKKGGLRTMPFVIANESFERVASVGLHSNMILYLKNEFHFTSATGASILFLWAAIQNFMPTLGAFLSDSYLGRFRVISLGSVVSLLGMFGLWLTALLPQARPPRCKQYADDCEQPKPAQLALLFSSFILMSIGAGGIRPCSLAFGADQFDKPDNPKNQRVLQSFFSWYYASVGISVMLSVTFLIYLQGVAGWAVGFGIPVGLMLFSAVMFFMGSPLYVKVKANKSLITGFAQVVAVAVKNRHLAFPPKNSHGLYHHKKGSKLLAPTEKLRFINKACLIQDRETDLNPDGSASEPWKLCTIQQVEELKCLIKVLPIWSTGIIMAVSMNQHSFAVLQATTMDRRLINNFKIPAASFTVFTVLTLTLWVTMYDRVIVPLISKYTKRPRGLSLKQRMGIGVFLSIVAMIVSALVERTRRRRAIHEGLVNDHDRLVNMSAMWLVPQHCLTGLAEAFNIIGQIEFYYSQCPKSVSSIAVALLALGSAFGNLVGSLIVNVVNDVSKRGGKQSWVSNNLNKGHYDYYYWILSILCVVNFFYFILCSWAYGGEEQKVSDEGQGKEEEDYEMCMESPLVFTA